MPNENNVIQGNFPNYRKMTLGEARSFLGQNFFKRALLNLTLTQLEAYVNHPESIISGTSIAYEAILTFRERYDEKKELEASRPLAQVIPFKKRAA